MNTVVVKIPLHILPSDNRHLKTAIRLRKWCHDHVNNGWRSYFLNSSDFGKLDNDTCVGFIAFEFEDAKEAMKFKLWAGSEQ